MSKTYYINKSNRCHVNEYVVDGETHSDLISYGKRVAYYVHETNEMHVHGWFSATTAKHINDFLEYFGFDRCSKKQLENYKQS